MPGRAARFRERIVEEAEEKEKEIGKKKTVGGLDMRYVAYRVIFLFIIRVLRVALTLVTCRSSREKDATRTR